MKISDRLQTIAHLVTKGHVVADIGTDHGYIPIYLVNEGIIQKAFAMDVVDGPLDRAKEHIAEYGFDSSIETRLSNGFEKLEEGEADTAIIAGMGGPLTIEILKKGANVVNSLKELIVSPHSDIYAVRTYLYGLGYELVDEKMLIDAGKYYVAMKWKIKEATSQRERIDDYAAIKYGHILLINKDEVLKNYLQKEKLGFMKIIAANMDSNNEDTKKRMIELEKEIKVIEKLLNQYYS